MSATARLGAALALVVWALGIGAAQAAPEDDQGSEKPYTATIDVQSTGSITYFDPLFVSIRVTPLRTIDVEEIYVVPLGPLKSLYGRGLDTSRSEAGLRCRFGANAGAPKRPFVATCELGELIGPYEQLTSPTVFMPPSRQKLAIEVQVRQDGGVVSYYDEAFVDFATPKIGVVYGGFFGALLLAVFTALREQIGGRVSHPPMGPLAWLGATIAAVAHGIWRTVAMSIVGGICALVVILLAQVTEGLAPPVSIHVQDFWGGVVVGLFSVPLSAWLAEKVRGDAVAAAAKASAAPATTPVATTESAPA